VVILITIGFVRQGRYEIGAWALNGIIFITLLVALRPGIDSDIDFMLVALVTVLSAVTLEERGLFMIGGASALVMLITYAQRLPSTTIPLSIPGMSAYGIFFATTFALVRFASVSRSAGRLAESEERFKLAEINSQITRQASERAKLDAAMDTALHLILENYSEIYHAQVFLIDDDGVQARLVASTGDTGQRLIDKGHSLAVGSLSVIGQTTFKGEPVIARSGEQNTVHRQNQLLPQTRLEAAFPLQVGGKIIGALDLQSREDLQLSDYDILSFQSLANSLSLSIDSIRQVNA